MMDVDEDKFFGLCKCCLQDGCFRSLWVEYKKTGQLQNYGEMLNECFSLHWQKPDNSYLEQICDDCAKRAMDAYGFWRQLLLNQDQLISYSKLPDKTAEVKSAQVLESASSEGTKPVPVKEEPVSAKPETDEYEEVEYLEVEVENEGLVDDPEFCPKVTVKRKWPKKKKKSERLRTYKQYTNDDLLECLEAVKSGSMTPLEASQYYNVPKKTVAAKILSEKRGELPCQRDKNEAMVKEIKTLLTYTNATPYKTRTAHYHCAYCSTDGPLFEDPDELRTHTRTQHAAERTKNVEHILRPGWLNEVLKVDIENLHCTVCCVVLVSWNDMFKHLKELHDIDFDETYTRVIPYILESELRCALCKESFPSYHHLDSHMNAHYSNYMCSECGDTFLSSTRLKKHLNIHENGRYECEECGKVFSLEKYRKKHIDLVHKHELNIRCLYCPEKFIGTYQRHQHLLQCHSEKVKSITCEACGRIFDWKPYYLAHMRKKHANEKNYKCSFCPAQFFMKSELRRHEDAHKATKDRFACPVCSKRYSTKSALKNHSSRAHDVLLKFKNVAES